eukprot:CAMPEP_0172733452 /NCGR_PEP_ID=MMETSP1074-20121228/107230_1 /TAXON_ID=2916 /ORGANISM="Ceratium fusus, Strain PA161109" /LENGTH=52 /DNA_ID=CAMNT_0013562007 /DNA_START=12 /DNA_END=167 /DNA_ORIENTATION=-
MAAREDLAVVHVVAILFVGKCLRCVQHSLQGLKLSVAATILIEIIHCMAVLL